MPPRKRKRDQAFLDETEPEINETNVALNEEQRAEKEQEIWDAIRETHYEAIEQLPLTLHRQLSLMRQLDEQSLNHTNRLLPSLHRYIQYRKAMDNVAATQPVEGVPAVEADRQFNQPTSQQDELPSIDLVADIILALPIKSLRSESDSQSSTPTRLGIPAARQKPPKTNREVLSHVAWLSEELLRAAQEKVCLAQTANDSVERHIRLLDQAIKEQEAALSVTSSNGTSIHLPDLVIPSRNRTARMRTISDAQNISSISVVEASSEIGETEMGPRRIAKKGWKDNRETSGNLGKDPATLTITLPATQPSEELYCYCNRISFGKMIACDNESCEHEWYHLGCVGLMEIPKGQWFCEYCRDNDDF